MQKPENKKRIFFALWPEDEVREKLTRAFNSSGFSKQARQKFQPDNLHLTLHFLGNVSEQKYNCVINAAQELKFNSFELVLNQFDGFQKAKIFYMGMTQVPQELLGLQTQLGEALSRCDFQPESRVFTPHVTLMRRIKSFAVENMTDEIRWRVTQFALVESHSVGGAVQYRPVKFFKCVV